MPLTTRDLNSGCPAIKRAQCSEVPTMGVESHWAAFLVPPADHPDVIWDNFPAEAQALPTRVDGTRTFVCDVCNQVSGTVEQ